MAELLFYYYLFLIGGWLLYDVVVVSAIQRWESAVSVKVCVCVCVFRHPTPLGLHHVPSWALCVYGSSPLAVYFIPSNTHVNATLSWPHPPLPPEQGFFTVAYCRPPLLPFSSCKG